MNIDWFTFIAQIVNFLILLALLRHFLYGPIQNIMNQREDEVRSRLEEARQKLVEAEEKGVRYQKKIDEFENQKETLLKTAHNEAEQKKSELIAEARKEVENMRNKWIESVKNEKESFYSELYQQTAEKIVDIVERIIRDLSNQDLEKVTIDKFLEKIRQAPALNHKKGIESSLSYGKGEISVVSNFQLSEAQKKRIVEALHDFFATEISVSFSTSKLLGFGIEVRMPGWKLGWNAISYLSDLEKSIAEMFEADQKSFSRVSAPPS